MLEELQVAFAQLREDDPGASTEAAWEWLWAGASLVPEVQRDVVTWSDDLDSAAASFRTGVRPQRIEIDGEVVLDEGHPLRVDPVEIRARAREEAQRLWRLL